MRRRAPAPVTAAIAAPQAPPGPACFVEPVDFPLPLAPFGGALGDLDNDGDLDFVVNGWPGDAIVSMANDGHGGFVQLARTEPEAGALHLTLVEATGDGVVDLVTAHPEAGELHLRPGDGRGGFGESAVISLHRRVFSVHGADLDGDGNGDLVATQFRHVVALQGNGHGGFIERPRVAVGGAPSYPFVADVDADRRLELVIASNDDGGVDVLAIGAKAKLGKVRHSACGRGPIALGHGDFDGDGRVDLVTANSHSDDVCVFGGGPNGFAERQVIDVAVDAVAVSDVDGDGVDEIALAAGTTVAIYGKSGAAMALRESFVAGRGTKDAWARDVDGDGLEDLVLLASRQSSFSVGEAGDASFTIVRRRRC